MDRTDSLDFGSFEPEQATISTEYVSRDAFRGLDTLEAATRIVAEHARRTPQREVTRKQRVTDIKGILNVIARKGHDLASVDAATMCAYREWLRLRVERGDISESYASHLAIAWNAVTRAVFGDEAAAPLHIKGFRQHAKKIVRLDEPMMYALVGAAQRIGFRTADDKDAFVTYLELAWPTGGRAGSLLSKTLTFECIDWRRGFLRFPHVKNKDEHLVAMSPRALGVLRARREYAATRPWWIGDATPICAGATGNPITTEAVNQALKRACVAAGIESRVTTHVIRKSAGTIMARENARYAMEQLGITAKVFEKHYNQPTIEDRLERRDLVPTFGDASDPVAAMGQIALDYEEGRATKAEYLAALDRIKRAKALPGIRQPDNTGYL
jgi:integrase